MGTDYKDRKTGKINILPNTTSNGTLRNHPFYIKNNNNNIDSSSGINSTNTDIINIKNKVNAYNIKHFTGKNNNTGNTNIKINNIPTYFNNNHNNSNINNNNLNSKAVQHKKSAELTDNEVVQYSVLNTTTTTNSTSSDDNESFTGIIGHNEINNKNNLDIPAVNTATATATAPSLLSSPPPTAAATNTTTTTTTTINNNNNNNKNNNYNTMNNVNDNNDNNAVVMDTESLSDTGSYFTSDKDTGVLLNKTISRNIIPKKKQQPNIKKKRHSDININHNIYNNNNGSNSRRSTGIFSTTSMPGSQSVNNNATPNIRQPPFFSHKHSQIIPVGDSAETFHNSNTNIVSTNNYNTDSTSSGSGSTDNLLGSKHRHHRVNDDNLKRSELASKEIRKMRQSLLLKRNTRLHNHHNANDKKNRKNYGNSLLDDDRVLVGNRVSEGHVNFTIAYNMLTGIRVAVSRCSGIMKPLTNTDFKLTKKLVFDYHGNESTPSSQYAFKFKDYSPEVFRELRCLFGIDPADYLMSLTSKYILSELNSPGKSGSFFYFSRDYKYIIKTIHHSEHRHLRKTLKNYYNHVKENPNTLISQFYGLHRVKMPFSYKNQIKHRKIYFLVMNNLFAPHLDIHASYDLKGSTWGRLTPTESHPNIYNENDDDTNRPVLKDLNWINSNMHIEFGPLKKQKFLEQLRKDVTLLSKLNIMDYSLLLGIHDMDRGNDLLNLDDGNENYNDNIQKGHAPLTKSGNNNNNNARVDNSHAFGLHYFQQYEGGIRSSDKLDHDTNKIYFIGIIDCLTNYNIIKRLETFIRSINHDLSEVSAIPPKAYSDRFYTFISKSIEPSPSISTSTSENVS
ncbi:uncharacterized protein SCODWIG_03381 [Saccharomycodes ludwigii]|uniref:1-phosphatidylinositol-4-phosphate 5-kinase n=2 Tax=Saccharomycodes ludwigii TaxID=36035 RepID=A0A376BBW9_9ASCO|nr:uncharacterized protein SCODWIG_03381 [Saccharomycodes ludwigii]